MTTEQTPPEQPSNEQSNAQQTATQTIKTEVLPQIPTPPSLDTSMKNDYTSLEGTGFSHVLNNLLKKPLSIIYEITHREHTQNIQTHLLAIILVGFAVFGLVLGIFSGGHQIWAAPIKIVGGILFSSAICLPSLYIFGALGGMEAKIQHIIGITLTFLAVTSLLLIGFAPVLWLFSTSSSSIVFFGFLSITLWILCLIFGLRIITRASKCMGGKNGSHLVIWSAIFIMVTLQMTTTLRPIIGDYGQFFNTGEKQFFIQYWFSKL